MNIRKALIEFDVLKGLIHTMTILLGISGLGSHYYSHRRKRYYSSKPMLLYACMATVIFSIVYLKKIYDDYSQLEWDFSNMGNLYTHLNIIASIISYVRGLMLERCMVTFMNKIELLDMINFFEMSPDMVRRPVCMVALRALLFPLIIGAMYVLRQIRNAPEANLLWTLYTLLPTVISQLMPNCVYGVLMLWKLLICRINERVQRICCEVNRLQAPDQMHLQKHYYRMQRFCELADSLDVLNERYTNTCRNSIEYLELLAIPFVCSLVSNLSALTLGFYLFYRAIADTVIDETDYDIFNAITNVVFLAISLSEIFCLADACNESLILVQETGIILQDINLQHADIRFKQSVEAFSLMAFASKYKIKPLGLLEINTSLIYNIFGAVFSFLLILIQSDLKLRFSMKEKVLKSIP